MEPNLGSHFVPLSIKTGTRINALASVLGPFVLKLLPRIYAKAKDSNVSEQVYYTNKNKLYVKLFCEHTDKILVCSAVTTLKQAKNLLQNFKVHEIHTSCNTDVSNNICKLSTSISNYFWKQLTS